jgi:hypothetical protein
VGYCWKVSKSRKNPFDQIESCRENGERAYWDADAVSEGKLKLNEIKRGERLVVSFLSNLLFLSLENRATVTVRIGPSLPSEEGKVRPGSHNNSANTLPVSLHIS